MSLIEVERVGKFHIPDVPESRRHDSEITVHGICGRHDPDLAHKLGEWGTRCGQEYSYLWRQGLEDVHVVLDIGANVGAFAVWASVVWWPGVVEHVHCYEPNDELFPYLEKNLELLPKRTKSTVWRCAVTTDPDPIFHEHEESGRSHTWGDRYAQGRDGDGWRMGRKVPGLHPRDLPPADAMKLDCEGTEGEIVHHYKYWDRLKVVMAEWHSHENRVALFQACEGNGLLLRKNDCGEAEQGVACFVRPA